ncbi:MAG TPA: hypothetical protein VMP89_11180 [Solirubrobacteraceae bacterium]|nr:hypothetical protein [Solirubrobacteraceae bacterium]
MQRAIGILAASAALASLTAACGSSSSSSSSHAGTPAATAAPATTSGGSAPTVGALSAEATSAATGDIPDNQAFLTYTNPVAHYSMSYPEGWALKSTSGDVSFSDKNNVVHVVVASGSVPTPASLAAELAGLKRSNPALTFTPPAPIQLKSGPAVRTIYRLQSAPNPVTGKSVLLIVDRYQFAHAGDRVTVDLGTPKGVDNVDAYRKMINSFTWH